ncbi:MAG: alpha/beta fold hydrolase [Peptococcaceae bacterium]|jgi:dienelactone hydrolase|nr:alpha/beta fold hydrolase [Peptococcaceae bacterium]
MSGTIYIKSDVREIPVVIELPAGEGGQRPGVVMLHGTASHKDEVGGSYRRLARLMAAEGIASVRLDFLGHGESGGFDGDFDFAAARSDLLAATAYLRSLKEVDPNRVGVMGWSQGGVHACLAAAEEPGFCGVVTWASGLWSTESIAPPKIRQEAETKGFGTVGLEWGPPFHVGRQWIEDADRLNDPVKIAGQISCPVLAIIGTEDFMTVAGVESIIAGCRNKSSRMYVIPGGNHTMNSLTLDTRVFYEAAAATILWWKEFL